MVIGDKDRRQPYPIDDMYNDIDEWMETQWGCETEPILAWGVWSRLPNGKPTFQSHVCEMEDARTPQCTIRFEHEPVA